MFFTKLMDIFTQFKLPRICMLCGYSTYNICSLCDQCRNSLPILPYSCQQCAQFLRFTDALKCGSCLSHPPAFDRTYALFPYEFPVDNMITNLKFKEQILYAKVLGELMAEQIKTKWYTHLPLPDLIIPIPLHRQRIVERGFNQSLEIARHLGKRIKIPIDYQGVTRQKPTLAQSGLSASLRKENIANSFFVQRNYRGKCIAVVDDVITTGSTVMECSRLLKINGAAQIHVWCCARNG